MKEIRLIKGYIDCPDNYVVTINLSDSKHKQRVLNIFESLNIIDNKKHTFQIKSEWCQNNQPTMIMDENDILDLSEALNELVDTLNITR